jgi:hypothetical protein
MRILIYKRTHNGDPDRSGCFGVHDCMGAVRTSEFDAVIGVGGIGADALANGIAGKINWIGIGPSKIDVSGKRGPEVTFDHFRYYGPKGPTLQAAAPKLAKRIYGKHVRVLLDGITREEALEAQRIVDSAEHCPPSTARSLTTCSRPTTSVCKSRRPMTRPAETIINTGCPSTKSKPCA